MPGVRRSNPHSRSIPLVLLAGGMTVLTAAGATSALAAGPDQRPARAPLPAAKAAPVWRLVAREEFNGTRLNPRAWEVYNSNVFPGTPLWYKRRPSAIRVGNGKLRITGTPNRVTGGVAWRGAGLKKYGRWQIRIRMNRASAAWRPVALLWPEVTRPYPQGEIDWMEIIRDRGMRRHAEFFLHFGPQGITTHGQVWRDMRKWHTFTLVWRPRVMRAFVDGRMWYQVFNGTRIDPRDPSSPRITFPPGRMGQAIQLDYLQNLAGTTDPGINRRTHAWLEVDWIRRYELR